MTFHCRKSCRVLVAELPFAASKVYDTATKGSNSNPCRNVPITCRLSGRDTESRPAVWRYNMEVHSLLLLSKPPSLLANPSQIYKRRRMQPLRTHSSRNARQVQRSSQWQRGGDRLTCSVFEVAAPWCHCAHLIRCYAFITITHVHMHAL